MFQKFQFPLLFSIFLVTPLHGAINGSDNFDDNLKDTAKWGPDENEDSGLLTETAQHLEYTAGNSDETKTAYRPWQLNNATYDSDWEVTLDVGNSVVASAGDRYASIGLEIFPAANPAKSVYISSAASTGDEPFKRVFETAALDNGFEAGHSEKPANVSGSIRVAFDSATKVISFFNDPDGATGGYSWTLQSSYSIAGARAGTTANASWSMSGADPFKIYINGYSYGVTVAPGMLFADNFNAKSMTTAVTLPVTDITHDSAVLHGTIHPAGLATTVVFECATDDEFGEFETTEAQIIPANAAATAVSANVTDLTSGGSYYVRIRATNAAGSVTGGVQIFSTPPLVPGPFSLTTNATSGSITVNPPADSYPAGSLVTLTATAPAGERFLAWTGSASGTQNPLGVVMDQPKSITANFSSPIASAADETGLTYTTGGTAGWFGQGLVSHDGIDAVRSGAIGDNQESWFQTTVNGAGEFSFWWMVSSEVSDELEFTIDGIYQAGISNQETWTKATFTLGAGSHTLRWRYKKDINLFGGQDAAWVDEVKWTPALTFNVWKAAQFTSAEAADVSVSGPNADPDHDGVVNLLEFALGGSPKDAANHPAPAMSYENVDAENYLTLSVAKPSPAVSGLTYTVQVSADLNQWFSGSAATTTMSDTAGLLKIRDNIPVSAGGKRFIRLQVSSNP